MNVCVVIPAAGRSRRFGAGDKLGQDLGGRPLLLRTIELFAKRAEVGSIVVAGPAPTDDDPDAFATFRERYAATLGFHGAIVVQGSAASRADTVALALAAVPADATHVAVHDAARPGVGTDLLGRLFEAADRLEAVVPGLPVADTLKRVGADATDARADDEDALADLILGDEGKVAITARPVDVTVDRTDLVTVQTPQVFRAELLRRAYAEADRDGATDDASLVERLGITVHVIDGDPRNFKVTTVADLELMRHVLGVRPPAERPVHKRF